MKNKILIVSVVILIFFNFITINLSESKETRILYDEDNLTNLLNESYQANIMIDLRDREDYEAGHIKGFINVPSEKGAEVETYLEKNKLKNKHIYLMCYSGKRSASTIEILQKKVTDI